MKHKTENYNMFLSVSIAILILCGIYLYTQSTIVNEGLTDQVPQVNGLNILNGQQQITISTFLANGNQFINAAMVAIDNKDPAGHPGAVMLPRIIALITDYQIFLTSLQTFVNNYHRLLTIDNGTAMYDDINSYVNSLSNDQRKQFVRLLFILHGIFTTSIYDTARKRQPSTQKMTINTSLYYLVTTTIPLQTKNLPLISVASVINDSQPNSSNTFVIALQTMLKDLSVCANNYNKIMCSALLTDYHWDGGNVYEYDVEYTFVNKYRFDNVAGHLWSVLFFVLNINGGYNINFNFT